MKHKLFFISFVSLLFGELPAFGQQRVDKYCAVAITVSGFSGNKFTAHLSIGKTDSLFHFKDAKVVEDLKKVDALTSSVDVLNYMGKLGWTVVAVAPTLYGIHEVERIYFKKSYDTSELISGE